jgi:hypothetical protein
MEPDVVTRLHFHTFMMRCFNELNPQTRFLPNWHNEVIATTSSMGRLTLNFLLS